MRCHFYFLENICKVLEDTGRGCCLSVDLHIPKSIKQLTDQFPFAPEHKLLNDCYLDEEGGLYPFFKKWSEANDGSLIQPFKGLVGTLYDKKNYGVHWRLLKFYVEHGLVITKIDFGVFFDEGDYLKDYVQLNINLRNQRSDELGKWSISSWVIVYTGRLLKVHLTEENS